MSTDHERRTCVSCGFGFVPASLAGEIEFCQDCIRIVRCYAYINAHLLCSCGDGRCVHNTKQRRAGAERLNGLLATEQTQKAVMPAQLSQSTAAKFRVVK